METEIKLVETFCDNFVSYYISHQAHFNVTGEDFYSNHKLLQKVYEDAQENIDDLGELIRSLGVYAPSTINDILDTASLKEQAIAPNAEDLLQEVINAQEHMVSSYKALYEIAEFDGECDISNFAQDRIRAHKKFIWMLQSSLES